VVSNQDVWKPDSIEIFINDLNVDVIIRAALIFVNLKIDKFYEILFVYKLLNTNHLKAK
jgi:hypothetical protein